MAFVPIGPFRSIGPRERTGAPRVMVAAAVVAAALPVAALAWLAWRMRSATQGFS